MFQGTTFIKFFMYCKANKNFGAIRKFLKIFTPKKHLKGGISIYADFGPPLFERLHAFCSIGFSCHYPLITYPTLTTKVAKVTQRGRCSHHRVLLKLLFMSALLKKHILNLQSQTPTFNGI